MASYCSKCGRGLEDGTRFCPSCGNDTMGQGNNNDQNGNNYQNNNTQRVIQMRDKSSGLAAVLSFLWAGLGQIYVGKIVRGLIFMLVWAIVAAGAMGIIFVGVLSGSIGVIGLAIIIYYVLLLIFWIWNIIDAHKLANEYNDYLMANGKRPW